MHVSDIASVVQAVAGGASKAPVLVAHSFGGLIAQKWVARGCVLKARVWMVG